MEVRDATESDLPAVAQIHVASWQSAYRGILADAILDAATVEERLRAWRSWARVPGVQLFVAEREDAVAGFCRMGPARAIEGPPARHAEVTHLYVAPEATGSGLGHALFDHALRVARSLGHEGLLLWVLEENAKARRFYASHGLHADGARHDEPDWLGPGVFEVRYRMRFDEEPAP